MRDPYIRVKCLILNSNEIFDLQGRNKKLASPLVYHTDDLKKKTYIQELKISKPLFLTHILEVNQWYIIQINSDTNYIYTTEIPTLGLKEKRSSHSPNK